MRTSCTHCGSQFEVPDKALGKQAKCKTCGKLFVLMPSGAQADVPMQEVEPTRRGGSTARIAPVRRDEVAIDSPLDRLADAAIESGSHARPVHGVSSATRQREPDAGYGRRRMARGASLSMSLGIAGLVGAGIGVGCTVAAMLVADQGTMLTLGGVACLLLLIAAILGMTAVANAAAATRHIKHARHPLGGRSQASTGVVTGWITLGLVFIAVVAGAIWLSKRGGIVLQDQVTPDGEPAPQAPGPGDAQPASP